MYQVLVLMKIEKRIKNLSKDVSVVKGDVEKLLVDLQHIFSVQKVKPFAVADFGVP